MGWAIMLLLTAAVGAALAPFAMRDKAALQVLAAALLVALAGYAWQGRPDLDGQPKPPPGREQRPDSEFAKMRKDMLGRFDRASAWLNIAESYHRAGDTRSAVGILRSGLRQNPDDPDLWIGLGNALVIHADGLITPAAELAFNRAAALAPRHPAPRFFYGMALAQAGRVDEAERVWREVLAEAPPGAPWRAPIEERLELIDRARAAGQLPPAAPEPQP